MTQKTEKISQPYKPNTSYRDNQRKRLYDSERDVRKTFEKISGYTGVDVKTPERYRKRVDEIMASEFIKNNFPVAAQRKVQVKFSSRMGGANANINRIKTGTGAFPMKEMILLHELAHVLTIRTFNYEAYLDRNRVFYSDRENIPLEDRAGASFHHIAGHGPEYAEVYLALVREFMGATIYLALRNTFQMRKVKVAQIGYSFSEYPDEDE